jgi:hypothetical protein
LSDPNPLRTHEKTVRSLYDVLLCICGIEGDFGMPCYPDHTTEGIPKYYIREDAIQEMEGHIEGMIRVFDDHYAKYPTTTLADFINTIAHFSATKNVIEALKKVAPDQCLDASISENVTSPAISSFVYTNQAL